MAFKTNEHHKVFMCEYSTGKRKIVDEMMSCLSKQESIDKLLEYFSLKYKNMDVSEKEVLREDLVCNGSCQYNGISYEIDKFYMSCGLFQFT